MKKIKLQTQKARNWLRRKLRRQKKLDRDFVTHARQWVVEANEWPKGGRH